MSNAKTRDITVIGASAGGIAALRTLLAMLPVDYPAAVFIVLHVAPDSPRTLHTVLNHGSALPVHMARDGDAIRTGHVYVAPPDHHVQLTEAAIRLSHGPRENRYRPSIDVLFRSAAVTFGARVTGVVLSGMLDDGSAGLWAIKQRGGAAVVQDPIDAEHGDMPRRAMETASVDFAVPVAAMASVLVTLAQESVAATAAAVPRNMVEEVRMASDQKSDMETMDAIGTRVPFTCPECGGALWEIADTGVPRFRCHVGHAYSLRTLGAEQTIRVEGALWAALRGLEERERLDRRMASDAERRGQATTARAFVDSAESAANHAAALRGLLAEAVNARVPRLQPEISGNVPSGG